MGLGGGVELFFFFVCRYGERYCWIYDFLDFWGNLMGVNFQREECQYFFFSYDENSCEMGSLDLE